jgi:hypothetical protein
MCIVDFKLDDVGGIFTSLREAITGKKIVDPAQMLELGTVLDKLENALMMGQLDVNKVEAAHPSVFVSGWRPAIGWIGAISLGYQFVLHPFLLWGMVIFDVPIAKAPPMLEPDMLYVIITGMLGIGGMRSYDKLKGKDTKQVGV